MEGMSVERMWFISFHGCQKGPFSQEEIMDLWGRGEIGPQQMFWRRGMVHWQRFDSIEELEDLFPPALPSLDRVTSVPREDETSQEACSSTPKEVLSPVTSKKEEGTQVSLRRVVYACIFLLLIAGGRELWRINSQPMKPPGLSQAEFQHLKEVVETPAAREVEFRFSFDPSVNRLWISSNLRSSQDIFIRLKALKGRVLSTGEVECKGKGKLKKYFAVVDQLSFTRGSQLYPGFYQIYLSYIYGGREKNFSDVLYLGEGSEREFARKLETYRELVKKTFVGHSSELAQRYSTLSSLVSKTESLFKEELGKIRRGRDITSFQQDYSSKVGQFLTSFTVDNFSRPEGVPMDLGLLQRQFDVLFHLSKSLAGLSSEIVQTISREGRVTADHRTRLKELFLQKFQTLRTNVQVHKKKSRALKPF